MECWCLACDGLECVVCGEGITPPGSAVCNVGYGLHPNVRTTDDKVLAFDRAFGIDSLVDFIVLRRVPGRLGGPATAGLARTLPGRGRQDIVARRGPGAPRRAHSQPSTARARPRGGGRMSLGAEYKRRRAA
jgi:hypothetical protein